MAKGGVKSKVSKPSAVAKKKAVFHKSKSVKSKSIATKAIKLHAKAEKSDKSKKIVSQKLIETIQKRKAVQQGAFNGAAKPNPFAPPPKRRGRRPKNIEYTPENREEEETVAGESDYAGIEYDTGIRVRAGGGTGGSEDRAFSFERMEDFDEELNFDW
jgi:hypothetical protein